MLFGPRSGLPELRIRLVSYAIQQELVEHYRTLPNCILSPPWTGLCARLNVDYLRAFAADAPNDLAEYLCLDVVVSRASNKERDPRVESAPPHSRQPSQGWEGDDHAAAGRDMRRVDYVS